jgi:hypothetical protein
MADIMAKIQTENFPNTKLEPYVYCILLDIVVIVVVIIFVFVVVFEYLH